MRLPRPPAAVIFDMDGLLFDTEKFYAESIITAAREVGCAMSHDVFLQLVGRSHEVNHRFLLEHYGADYPLEALIATWGRHFRALTSDGLPLKPGAVELLDLLDELGLPRAIATCTCLRPGPRATRPACRFRSSRCRPRHPTQMPRPGWRALPRTACAPTWTQRPRPRTFRSPTGSRSGGLESRRSRMQSAARSVWSVSAPPSSSSCADAR